MAFKNIKKNQGKDFNYFERVAVNWFQFGAPDGYTIADGYGPDLVIPFSTQGFQLINENAAGATNKVVEYSFNGTTVHGDLNPLYPASIAKMFENRVICLVWFRLKAGSTGPVNVSLEAWSIR